MSEAPKGLRVGVRRLAAILSSDIAGCSRLMRRKKARRFANSNEYKGVSAKKDRSWTQSGLCAARLGMA
jgi:class 3 adenylate cyclase